MPTLVSSVISPFQGWMAIASLVSICVTSHRIGKASAFLATLQKLGAITRLKKRKWAITWGYSNWLVLVFI